MSEKRLFKSSEDFTRDVVQIEILVMGGHYFVRNYDRIVVNGKFKKAKRGWVKLGITDLEFKKMCCAFRNRKPYKIQFDKRFLYSVKVNPMIGENIIMSERKVYLIRAMRYDIAREIAVSFGLGPSAWRYVSDREELQPPFGLPRGYKWTDAIPLKRRRAEDYTLEIAEQRWVEDVERYFKEIRDGRQHARRPTI